MRYLLRRGDFFIADPDPAALLLRGGEHSSPILRDPPKAAFLLFLAGFLPLLAESPDEAAQRGGDIFSIKFSLLLFFVFPALFVFATEYLKIKRRRRKTGYVYRTAKS